MDHAWGGGLDAKYFMNRYLALGVEGYLLSADRDVRYFSSFAGMNSTPVAHANQTVGAGLGTLTLRYPIGASRFAPYVFAGAGAIAGGGRQLSFEAVNLVGAPAGTNPLRARFSDGETQAVGQFGGGLEVRVTPHVGVMSDFSWAVINGAENNFGMVRSGLNFAF